MGVRGLESYLEKHCPTACVDVNILELISDYKKVEGNEALIVIDGLSVISTCYRNSQLHWLSGGQLKLYNEIMCEFIDKLQEVGAKIVIYFDGTVVDLKIPVWINRRLDSVGQVYNIFDKIKSGYSQVLIEKEINLFLPNGIVQNTHNIFKNKNCQVFQSIIECDEEISKFAIKHNAFAILAQDSDFVILEGAEYYLSSKNLNLNDMTTKSYSRKKLAEALGISTKQLALIATLLGNDTITYNDLNRFHYSILTGSKGYNMDKFSIKINNLSYFVKKFPDELEDEHYKKISEIVFNTSQKAEILKKSVENYLNKSQDNNCDVYQVEELDNNWNEWNKILRVAYEKHKNSELLYYVYGLLCGKYYTAATAIEDFRKIDFKSIQVILKNLREYAYGILFYEKPFTEAELIEAKKNNVKPQHKIPELIMMGPNSFEKAQFSYAGEITIEHPGLLELWNENSDEVTKIKWNLLAYSVKATSKDLEDIPLHYIVPSLALKYIFRKKCLTAWETAAVLLTVFEVFKISVTELKQFKAFEPNEICPNELCRIIELSTLYGRTAGFYRVLLSIIGDPTNSKDELWDGICFQHIYRKISQYSTAINVKDKILQQLQTNSEKYQFQRIFDGFILA